MKEIFDRHNHLQLDLMIIITRTNSDNTDFQQLVAELDADLKIRDGADHAFYAQFNKTDTLKYAIVAYDNDLPVGCGAKREYATRTQWKLNECMYC
jgi:hypothetical protein